MPLVATHAEQFEHVMPVMWLSAANRCVASVHVQCYNKAQLLGSLRSECGMSWAVQVDLKRLKQCRKSTPDEFVDTMHQLEQRFGG